MLEDNLAAALKAQRLRALKIAAAITGLLVICAFVLMFFSATCCDFLTQKETTPTAQQPASPAATTAELPTIDNSAARQRTLDALQHYQNDLEPQLARIDLDRWQPLKASHLDTLKQAALQEFANANYPRALEQVQQAVMLAEGLITSAAEAFKQAMTAAQAAYDEDDHVQARMQIEQAQLLDQQAEEARLLAEKIATLGNVLPLLSQADIARLENQPEKELQLIEELLALAPDRPQQQARRQELITQLNLQRYQAHIANATAAIEQGKATAARKELMLASRLYPDRREVETLSLALEKLERRQRSATHARQAQAAIRSDNWAQAQQQLMLALKQQAEDKSLTEQLEQAEAILSLQSQVDSHLANPYRLADTATSTGASAVVAAATRYRRLSPRLETTAARLDAVIAGMNRKVEVTVHSDNQTRIRVRGIGNVGITPSKTIQLKPGTYTFEGQRTGYKSKLIDVLVPYDQNSLQITVICDEPI